MAEVRIMSRALEDIEEVARYISKTSKQNAVKVIDRFYKLFDELEKFPEMGVFPKDELLKNKGYRMLVSDRYLLFYVIVNDSEIQIRRVLHGTSKYYLI